MIDVSDGLLADLGHLARASGVGIDVLSTELEIAEPLRVVAVATGTDPMTMILTGGEDHALAATFPAEVALPAGLAADRPGERAGGRGRCGRRCRLGGAGRLRPLPSRR